MKQYRYPGPQPFSERHRHIFFGREKEIDELQRLVRREPWLVLYGKSGLGKSSLLNAGLAPQLAAQDGMAPVFVRFHAWTPGRTDNPSDIAGDLLRTQLQQRVGWLEKLAPGDRSLWRLLKEMQMLGSVPGTVLLIFDQFEELFTFPQPSVDAFAKGLAEVFYTDIPERYRLALERESGKNPAFLSETVLRQLHEPLPLRVVTAIRTDRMALMHQLKPFLPGTLDVCYDLRPLSASAAEEAVLNPAYDPGDFQTPRFDYDDDALDTLVDFLSAGRVQDIESFQLQILCEHLEKNVVDRSGRSRIAVADLSDPEGILANYYMDKIGEIADPEARLSARRLIEEGLIFEEEERRLTLFEGQIQRVWGVSPALLSRLEDTHLLRREPSLRGGYTYELSHDTLVAPVLKAKIKRRAEEFEKLEIEEARKREAQRLLKEKAERAEQERELKEIAVQAKIEAEKTRDKFENQKKRAQKLTLVAFSLSCLAIIATCFAFSQYKNAQMAQRKSEANLINFLHAQAVKEMLQFDNLELRAKTILEAGGCPKEIIQEMNNIAQKYPDSLAFAAKIDLLYLKNPDCK